MADMSSWRRLSKHWPWVLSILVWSVAFRAAPGQSQSLDSMFEPPAVWRAFRPLVIAMGEGDSQAAARYLRAGNQILRKADVNLERDAATQAFQTKAHECMEEFDLESFLALLPEREGAFRYFGFAGEPAEKVYKVRAARGADFEVNAKSVRRGFGESSGVLKMRQVEKNDSERYLVHWRSGAGFGALSWSSILAGISDAIAMFDERAEDKDTPLVLRAADRFLKNAQPALGPEDRRFLSVLWGSYPEVAKLLSSIGTTEDVIAAYDVAPGVTHVRSISRWDLPRLARAYPELADYFRDLDKLAEAKLRLTDGNGHTLFELWLDTEHMRSRFEAFVRGGKIVPSKDGKPLPDQAPRYEHMRAHTNLHFQAFRVHIQVLDLVTELHYDEHATGAELSGQILRTPRIRVTGAAFGVLPTGMLDWFIPGDMEGLARRLLDAATRGNDGRGIEWRYRFERPAGGLATLDGSVGMEVLDSALIRFSMAIAAERVVPDDDQLEDIRRLAADYRDAFDSDVQRFAKFGRLAPLPAPAVAAPN
jgi:hypothetical protein